MKLCASLAILLAPGLLLNTEHPTRDTEKGDKEKVQGTWKVVKFEARGESAPQDFLSTAKYVFIGDKVTIKRKGDKDRGGTFKLDATKNPRAIVFTASEGPEKDKPVRGIYSLEGDTLKLCLPNGPGKERPTEFTADPDFEGALITLHREKP